MKKMYAKNLDLNQIPIKTKTERVGRKNLTFAVRPACFDIETSSDVINGIKTPWLYHWQFQLEDTTILGCTWVELNQFLAELNKKLDQTQLIVCVHNLDFEFSFMQSWIKFNDVFRNSYSPNKIYYATVGNIRFIDTAKITGKTLQKFTEGCQHAKLSDFDYDVIRFPDTKLTDEEEKYCIFDVLGLQEAVERLLKDENMRVIDLPLTETGFIKKLVKHTKDWSVDLPPFECLKLLQETARGGNVWANNCATIAKNVDSQDANSMYPAVMVSEKFPTGKWQHIKNATIDDVAYYMRKNYAFIGSFIFKYLIIKNEIKVPYLQYNSTNKVIELKKLEERVLSADLFETTLTDLDLMITMEQYDFSEICVTDLWICKYGFLPTSFRKLIIEHWQNKEKASGVKRNQAKRFINSIFGCMGQNPLYAKLELDDMGQPKLDTSGHYTRKEGSEKDYDKTKWTAWSTYAWFVWTSAWGRYRLQKLIDIVGNDFMYCDTDAVKFTNSNKYSAPIKKLNNEFEKKNLQAGAPRDIGKFRTEYFCDRFVSVGPKQWCAEIGGELKLTVSGLKKTDLAMEELKTAGGLDAFQPGFVFHETGLGPVLFKAEPHKIIHNGHEIEIGCGRLIEKRPDYPLEIGEEWLTPEQVQQALQQEVLKNGTLHR